MPLCALIRSIFPSKAAGLSPGFVPLLQGQVREAFPGLCPAPGEEWGESGLLLFFTFCQNYLTYNQLVCCTITVVIFVSVRGWVFLPKLLPGGSLLSGKDLDQSSCISGYAKIINEAVTQKPWSGGHSHGRRLIICASDDSFGIRPDANQ